MALTIHTLFIPTILLLLLSTSLTLGSSGQSERPHIVIVMADDLGWNDVGFQHPSNQMVTPTIDRLAAEGVNLKYSYMLKSCTPSRSTFLTGVYAYKMGLQHTSLFASNNDSVPLDKKMFSQELQENGYRTHYVGKWHLGFCKPEMTPTRRGFDTFYGMYNGVGDYYTHISKFDGYDIQDDNATHYGVDWSAQGVYSTTAFTNKAVEIINNHPACKPLFLFLSYQAVHGPLQVPARFINEHCANVSHGGEERQTHCAMTAAMDEGIGTVIQTLKDKGLYSNSIIFFTSDNGGPVKLGSSNWPLRGSKITEWEGGTRVVSILHSEKYLPGAPYAWNGLIHAVDWYPTILRMAGITTNNSHIDGADNWDRIVNNQTSKRTEFVYNINEVKKNYAIRWMQYKLVRFSKPQPAAWYLPPPGEAERPDPTDDYKQDLLFDLDMDPFELTNLAAESKYNCIISHMRSKLAGYEEQLVETRPKYKFESGKPINFNYTWTTNWC